MHRAWNGFDVLENPTGNSADPRSTRGMSTRGAIPAGSPDGPNYRPQAALREEYRQPRAYAANPGTAAREHASRRWVGATSATATTWLTA